MKEFVPVNSLEILLRTLLTDKNTPLWNFYTPLAAAPLWVIAQHHPELDGSDRVAPEGKNPAICVFNGGAENSFIGIYTAECRAREVFQKWKISEREYTCISAPGYQLLSYLYTFDSSLIINAGLPECRYTLDPDMVGILLSRPEPSIEKPTRHVQLNSSVDPKRFLGPLKEFLGRQPNLRAAWIFEQKPDSPLPAGHHSFEIELLMKDPEDKSLLHEVGVMAKALTPIEMEWTTAVIMADDKSLRNLSKNTPPFYAAGDFLKESGCVSA